jgi:glycosyltransferase involved in cell wall biosynthesis
MKIGINGYEAVVPRFGYTKEGIPNRVGSAEVCFQLLVELSRLDKKNSYIIYLPCPPTKDMPEESARWRYRVVVARRFWTLFALPRALRHDMPDIFFSPTHYSPFFIPMKTVLTILDVSYKYFPEMFTKKDLYKLSWWGKFSVRKSKKIITISESSKDDIIKTYGINAKNIEVIHLGIKKLPIANMTKEELFKKYSITMPYILFVGTLQPRKNLVRLIQAISLLKNKDIKLVIIGKKGWMYEDILSAPEKFDISDRVIFLHNVINSELPLFYKYASLFVLPSLYEGFGLPILEAMKYKCPVVTSKVSSLPEAGGEAALYINPEDVSEIAEKIDEVLVNTKLRERMVKLGDIQVKKFSWEKTASEVIKVFEEMHGEQ